MRVELWSRDEYGQGSILESSGSFEKPQKKLESYLYEKNIDNVLTSAEKLLKWEAYCPVVFDGDAPSKDKYYAGNATDGKHRLYEQSGDKFVLRLVTPGDQLRFYLGKLDKKDWFLHDEKKRVVNNLKSELLRDKESLFFKVIDK